MAAALPDPARRPDAEALRQAGLQLTLSHFVLAHQGIPAVVIGGGITRSSQVAIAPPAGEAIYFSANAHGLEHWRCHYAVCLDMIEDRLRKYPVPLVSPRRFAEVRIFEQPCHQSGMMAAYVAWAMGCTPILLAGCDCYQGGVYEENPKAKSSGTASALNVHLKSWGKLRDMLAGGDLRSLGGTLAAEGVLPLHDPALPGRPPTYPKRILKQVAGLVVEFRRPVKLHPIQFIKGDIAEISINEARKYRQSLAILGRVADDPGLLRRTVPSKLRRVHHNVA